MSLLMKLFVWSTRALIINTHCCRITFYRECMKKSVGKAEEPRLSEGFLAVTDFQIKTPGHLLCVPLWDVASASHFSCYKLLDLIPFNLLKAAETNPSFPPNLRVFCSTLICALLSPLWHLSHSRRIFLIVITYPLKGRICVQQSDHFVLIVDDYSLLTLFWTLKITHKQIYF